METQTKAVYEGGENLERDAGENLEKGVRGYRRRDWARCSVHRKV